MKFLLPVGGVTDHRFGMLTTPAQRGVLQGIRDGMNWAADNGCFKREFDPTTFFSWLKRLEPYKSKCMFVVAPDKVGDAHETLWLFKKWRSDFGDWPVAFVAQDGQEHLDFPEYDQWSTLFIGGSTSWKLSYGAIQCIDRAMGLGKHIHIGRVNARRRYRYFRAMKGSEDFTCDGTRTRFDGTQRTIEIWAKLMDEHVPTVESYQLPMFVLNGNSFS